MGPPSVADRAGTVVVVRPEGRTLRENLAGSVFRGFVVTEVHRLDPRQEYLHRRDARLARASTLSRQERLLGLTRLAVFLLGLLDLWLVFGADVLAPGWLVVPLTAFVFLLFWHESVVRALYRTRQSVAFYEAGLRRLDHDWQGRGRDGERFKDDHHPYAADLDLFGKGSLFELLCAARTRTGEDTLAGWLKAGTPPEIVRGRQQGVSELAPQLDLREELALLGGDVPAGVDLGAVASWGAGPVRLRATWLRWPLLGLGLISLSLLSGWLLTVLGYLDGLSAVGRFFLVFGSVPFACVLAVQGIISLVIWKQVQAVLGDVEKRARDLAMLARVLARLEQTTFHAPSLVHLQAEIAKQDGVPASQQIARLSNLLDLLNSRKNQLFAPVAALLLWGTQMACAIESWRRTSGPHIARWLTLVGEFEALCSLAGYAFENSGDPFPAIVDQGPVYTGVGLGHPLLPESACVRNDLNLSSTLEVLIVSGSNMSGKSTFLRTVGINAVLALAGAPVRAQSLRISPLVIGATLRIQDSLQEGKSRFYAEILRVRQVVDLARGKVPLLFLLDEIFAGTNSHDRRQGAEAVVRGLVKAGAMGLVTTHDLSLTQMVEPLGERAANVHFADHFEDGVMRFDYTLRPGVVQHSNALALMRAVGLEV